jgi:hypothetical protein
MIDRNGRSSGAVSKPKLGVTGRGERQPRLFEDDTPTAKTARRNLWLDPIDCPHLEWDKTETTWPDRVVSRGNFLERIPGSDTTLTWTCSNCGTVRGRASA